MPAAVSYQGVELQHIIVGEPGPNRGRRTTNWCTCKCYGSKAFLVTRADIQQAIKGDRGLDPRCDSCRRERPAHCDLVGSTVGNVDLVKRLPNIELPGGRLGLMYLGRCRCDAKTELKLRYSTLKGFLKGRRKKVLSCGCKDFDLSGKWFGLWCVLGPCQAPAGKEASQQRWWLVECRGSCERTRKVVSTSDLQSKRGTRDCGCQAGVRQSRIWEKKRAPLLVLGVSKLRKGIVKTARMRGLDFKLTDEQCAKLCSRLVAIAAPCVSSTRTWKLTLENGAGVRKTNGEILAPYFTAELIVSIQRVAMLLAIPAPPASSATCLSRT